MKTFLSILLSSIIFIAQGQNVKFSVENVDGKAVFFAANDEFCPVSVVLELNLTNMAFSEKEKRMFIVPARSVKFKVGELSVVSPRQRTSYNYRYRYTVGEIDKKEYNKDYQYDLPFQKGKEYKVFQGYKGRFSHQNENAIDFIMPEGSEILAARDGVVIKIVQENTETCPRADCAKYNNYINVYHNDGTFASYAHIKYNGSKVKVGDTVKKGDVIALSGNTGFSSGPHLHFVCFLPELDKMNTLETKFRIDDGATSVFLAENQIYVRQY